jgi:hypothetical protein
MRRLPITALGLLCMAFTGCVEGEQTFTLNPDGSGKVSIKVVMPPFDLRSAIKQPAKESLEDMRRGMLQPLLQTLGVEAWKDVSADFTPDGHLKFTGTAYFKNYNHLEWGVAQRRLPSSGRYSVWTANRMAPSL